MLTVKLSPDCQQKQNRCVQTYAHDNLSQVWLYFVNKNWTHIVEDPGVIRCDIRQVSARTILNDSQGK